MTHSNLTPEQKKLKRDNYLKEYQRTWYLKNRERLLDKARKYREQQGYQEKSHTYYMEYKITKKVELAEKKRLYYLKNKERIAAYKKIYGEHNRIKINAYRRVWERSEYHADPTKALLKVHARRAKTKGIKINKEEISNWESRICGICKLLIEGEFHIDHIIPISKGGLHEVSNLQLAHPFCNLSKKDKLIA